jgi:predicted NBD/HSP70 family sugar kinase
LVETDANAAGWAQWHALDPRPQRFVYLTLGTGVGGCVILDGAIVRHTHDGPGHLGHSIVDTARDAPKCRCGARGCLEALLADANGPLARPLAIALVQIAHLYAPEVIALGGGKVDSAPDLVDRTRAEFEPLKSTLVPREIQLLRAPLSSNEAGVIGAALLTMQT